MKKQNSEWGYYKDLFFFCGKMHCINKFIYRWSNLYNKKKVKYKRFLKNIFIINEFLGSIAEVSKQKRTKSKQNTCMYYL